MDGTGWCVVVVVAVVVVVVSFIIDIVVAVVVAVVAVVVVVVLLFFVSRLDFIYFSHRKRSTPRGSRTASVTSLSRSVFFFLNQYQQAPGSVFFFRK